MDSHVDADPRDLGDWVRRNRERLLSRWLEAAAGISANLGFDRAAMLDTIPLLIDEIADVVRSAVPGTAASLRAANVHALDRFDAGLELDQVVAEYFALRQVMLTLIDDDLTHIRAAHLAAIDQVLDTAITIAIRRFKLASSRTLAANQLEQARDAQQRQQLVSQLQRSEEQFRVLADNIPQLAWMTDEHGRTCWHNRRWFDYTGSTLDEAEGRGWQRVIHPEYLDRALERVARHLASGELWEETLPLRGRDGTYRWFLSRAIPLRGQSGRVTRWIGTHTDITERIRLDEAREQFIGILGHDLRSPLNTIVLSTHVLKTRAAEAGIAKIIDRIASTSQRMRQMIDDLLDFTTGRLGGGIPVSPKTTDLRAIVRAVIDEIEGAHPGRRIVCESDGDTTGTWDGLRLGQAVQNLVTNAIQHGDARAPIVVAIDGRERDVVKLAVTNEGPPIPPKLVPTLFEPFRSLAAETGGRDMRDGHLGLGLFIVKEIVRAHGGSIQARSTAEDGTRFEMQLPRVAGPRGSQNPR